MKRIILLLDMDAFFAMVEERENPHFAGKPIVVGADPKEGRGRGVVSTANYEARKYGIHSALPISEAFRLCPSAVFLPVQGELYSRVSENIMEILKGYAPLMEQVSLDEAYLDISFIGSFEKAKELAEKIRNEIFQKEKLPASCGIAQNKMVAKIACEKAKPNGVLVVEQKESERFLLPLGIREIPGVGPKTKAVLEKFFEKRELKIQDVKKATREELVELLGIFGNTLYEKVRGIDESPVAVAQEVKSVGKEHTFEKDTRDAEEIFPVFQQLISEVCTELKEEGFSCKTITVVCRFQGFETHTKAKSFKEPLQDWKIFEKEAMQLLLKFLTENLKPVRLIGVRARVAAREAE
ncbi:MAG: DNA polymerase IV [bacterium]|nr:DNA polymerase IV [bacterium]